MRISGEALDKLVTLKNHIGVAIECGEGSIEEIGELIMELQDVKADLNKEWQAANRNSLPINYVKAIDEAYDKQYKKSLPNENTPPWPR